MQINLFINKPTKMKKLFITMAVLFTAGFSFAQTSEKFIKAMESKIMMIDSAQGADTWKELTNAFERIGDAEKTQWLPYYYSAYGHLMIGFSYYNGQMGNISDKTDPETDQAEVMLNKAIALSKETSETWVIKKLIATLRMIGDPMNRYMIYSPQANEALQKAKELDPNNPRVYLLEGEDKFQTPEQYGGSKEEAKVLFEKAKASYETFKPENSIHPNWGLSRLMYYFSQYK
jgi:tetratricopeptide (TPR) repeat protein